jgi:hypothetical protein
VDHRAVPSPTAERLAHAAVAGAPVGATLEPELAAWLTGSPRFRAFVEANLPKVRKKLRGAADDEALRDVRLELQVARLLLGGRRVSLAWEALGSGMTGPDFTLALPGLRPLHLEVTRLRRDPAAAEPGVPWLAKLRQLPPGAPGAILVGIEGTRAEALDLASSVRAVRERADAKDEAFLAARGVEGSRPFYAAFLRLGAMLAWCEDAPGDERVGLWRNGSARIPVPEPALRACVAALRAEGA